MKDECYESNEEKIPQVVDLGLISGTRWASCNLGASQPWEYGGYYAWGETEEKDVYNHATYRYFEGEDTNGDGFYEKDEKCENLGENICNTEYDVAHMKLGDGWQMPTREQFMELIDNCIKEWTELHGVKGLKFIGPNGNSIFLPAGGCRNGSGFDNFGDSGCYWSSMVSTHARFNAHNLLFSSSYAFWYGYCSRSIGHSIRPVKGIESFDKRINISEAFELMPSCQLSNTSSKSDNKPSASCWSLN